MVVAQCSVLECDKSVAARFIEKSTTSRFTPRRVPRSFCPNKCYRTFSEALGGCLRKDRLGVCGVKNCRTDRFPTKGFACRRCMPAVRVETDRRFRPEMLAFMCYQCPRKQILEEFWVPIPESTRECVKTCYLGNEDVREECYKLDVRRNTVMGAVGECCENCGGTWDDSDLSCSIE